MMSSYLQIRHDDIEVSLYFSFDDFEFFVCVCHGTCVIKFSKFKYKTFVMSDFINKLFSKQLDDWKKMFCLNATNYIVNDIELCKIKYTKTYGF